MHNRSTSCSAHSEDDYSLEGSGFEPESKSPPYAILLALAAGGVAETSYLTLSKLLAAPVACPTSGCDTVLSSGYAELFGIPLSAFGLVAYAAVALLVVSGQQKLLPQSTTRLALLANGTVLASCSSFLLYTLVTQFPGDNCFWCLTSATLSFGVLAAALSAYKPSRRREARDVGGPALGLAAAVLAFLGFSFSGVEGGRAFDMPYSAPAVTRPSPPGAVDLAARLNKAGAKMYGAFWCSHCFDQKQDFGKDAVAEFPYVECYPDGMRPDTKMTEACAAANLQAFPTWIIDGQKLEGEQTFEKLSSLLPANELSR